MTRARPARMLKVEAAVQACIDGPARPHKPQHLLVLAVEKVADPGRQIK